MNNISRFNSLDEAGEQDLAAGAATPSAAAGARSLVLVGLMGAGKSTVGRRLAQTLQLPFRDADHEIEAAAGMTIPEFSPSMARSIFATASAG